MSSVFDGESTLLCLSCQLEIMNSLTCIFYIFQNLTVSLSLRLYFQSVADFPTQTCSTFHSRVRIIYPKVFALCHTSESLSLDSATAGKPDMTAELYECTTPQQLSKGLRVRLEQRELHIFVVVNWLLMSEASFINKMACFELCFILFNYLACLCHSLVLTRLTALLCFVLGFFFNILSLNQVTLWPHRVLAGFQQHNRALNSN